MRHIYSGVVPSPNHYHGTVTTLPKSFPFQDQHNLSNCNTTLFVPFTQSSQTKQNPFITSHFTLPKCAGITGITQGRKGFGKALSALHPHKEFHDSFACFGYATKKQQGSHTSHTHTCFAVYLTCYCISLLQSTVTRCTIHHS